MNDFVVRLGFEHGPGWSVAVVVAGTLALMLAHLGPAAAAPVPATTDGQVLLTAATAGDDQARRLEAAVQEAATAIGLRVIASRVARIDAGDVLAGATHGAGPREPTTPVARLWIDAAGGSPASLYLTDGAGQRVYVRQVPLERGLLDRVALATIALIVRSSFEALAAGRQIGVTREDFARIVADAPRPPSAPGVRQTPVAPPPSPMTPSSPRDATVTARYELGRAVPLPYQQRILVEYDSRWRRFCAGAGVFAAVPQTIERASVGANIYTAGAILSVGAHWGAMSLVRLTAGVGVGIESARVQPSVSTTDLRPSPPFWSGALSLRSYGLLERTLTPISKRWIVGLAIGVEVHPSPERYLVGNGRGDQVLLQGPRWRPLAGVLIGTSI